MRPFDTIIIEDESLARKRLLKLLSSYENEIQIIAIAEDGKQGLELIEHHQPELIFLDIQMPLLNGFEMLKKIKHQPHIIFTTAYEEYAIQAFEENSVDYLLKPIRAERLEKTVNKLKGLRKEERDAKSEYQRLLEIVNQLKPKKALNSLTVSLGNKIILLKLENIFMFRSEDKMTIVVDDQSKEHLINHSLNYLEDILPDNFKRIHRSHIINFDGIKEIRRGFNGKLVFEMNDQNRTKVTTGSSYTSHIKEQLKF